MTTNEHSLEGLAQWHRKHASILRQDNFNISANMHERWADAVEAIQRSDDTRPSGGAATGQLPKEPPLGLLMSMAIRYDHGLGIPDYYDDSHFMQALGGVSHARRLESTLGIMRQLYEEVSGYGFYQPAKETMYASGKFDWLAPGAADNDSPKPNEKETPAQPQPAGVPKWCGSGCGWPNCKCDVNTTSPAVLWNGPVTKGGSPAPLQSMTVNLTTGKTSYDDGISAPAAQPAKAPRMLTDEEIVAIGKDAFGIDPAFDGSLMQFARSVESAALASPVDIDRDTDGELLIDWSPARGREVFLSLRDDGRLSYAIKWDGESSHGQAQMPAAQAQPAEAPRMLTDEEIVARVGAPSDALQERYDFVLVACRDAQDIATRYGWALNEIAGMDPAGRRADDLGRAARIAREALLGTRGVSVPAASASDGTTPAEGEK